MKKLILSIVTIAVFNLDGSAQNVNIPDANFKAYLVGNTAINTNSDTEIQVSEAVAFTGDIFASNSSITDLTGIEAFTSITGLYCGNNNIGALDLSANSALTFVDCSNSNVTSLTITSCTALEGINCNSNDLTSLDVSNNTALTSINCSNNEITSLDVSTNVLLTSFTCDNNNLTSINVSNNPALIYFVCHFNDLTSIDLSNCAALSHFSCSGNDLTSLDVSSNNSLSALYCSVNSITNLDVSGNTSLQVLRCDDNNLSSLNVKNGNNVNFTTFFASLNPNLTCIEVDDDVWSTTNWTNIDPAASFSEDCNYNLDLNEENLSQNVSIYPNPTSENLTIDLAELGTASFKIIDIMGKTMKTISSSNNIIDVSDLVNGVYYLQIETNSKIIQKRFIKN